MTLRESPALLQALALLDNPRGSRPGPSERLPPDILGLLRIAAGDQERVASAASNCGLDQESIRDAAVFYIQQVLFASGSDSYRTLGVDRDAAQAQLREHHRWLLRWLHPDRNSDPWEAVYAERVGGAWQTLRNPERRRSYDQRQTAAPLAAAFQPPPLAPRLLVGALAAAAPSTSPLRWLPGLVLGTLALGAVLAVGLLYAMHAIDAQEVSATAQAQSPAASPVPPLAKPFNNAASASLRDAEQPVVLPEAQSVVLAAALPAAGIAPSPHDPVAPVPAPVPVPVLEPVSAPAIASMNAPSRPRVEAPAPRPALSERTPLRESATPGEASLPNAAVPSVAEIPLTTAQPSPPLQSVAGAAVTAVVPPPAVAPGAPMKPRAAPRRGLDDALANTLVGDFSESYRRGDLGRMQTLLTDDARSAGSGRGSLMAEYGALFAASEGRRLTISNVSWFINGDTASIIASYEASVQMRRGGRPRQSRGDIRLDLRLEEGQWRIYRLAHDDHPG